MKRFIDRHGYIRLNHGDSRYIQFQARTSNWRPLFCHRWFGRKWNGYHNLPYSIRILLEGALRGNDGFLVTEEDVRNIASWTPNRAN